MFSFTKEQKIIDISGIRLGGQPGVNPTVLFGGFFFKGNPDFNNSKKQLEEMYELSKKTGNPAIPDFFIKKAEYIEEIIDFIVGNVPKMMKTVRKKVHVCLSRLMLFHYEHAFVPAAYFWGE